MGVGNTYFSILHFCLQLVFFQSHNNPHREDFCLFPLSIEYDISYCIVFCNSQKPKRGKTISIQKKINGSILDKYTFNFKRSQLYICCYYWYLCFGEEVHCSWVSLTVISHVLCLKIRICRVLADRLGSYRPIFFEWHYIYFICI